jgi:hypothetical protein
MRFSSVLRRPLSQLPTLSGSTRIAAAISVCLRRNAIRRRRMNAAKGTLRSVLFIVFVSWKGAGYSGRQIQADVGILRVPVEGIRGDRGRRGSGFGALGVMARSLVRGHAQVDAEQTGGIAWNRPALDAGGFQDEIDFADRAPEVFHVLRPAGADVVADRAAADAVLMGR